MNTKHRVSSKCRIRQCAGPKDLPRIARTVGVLTGRATGIVQKARSRLFQYADEAELTQLHQELQHTLQQLHSIKNELKAGSLLMKSPPTALTPIELDSSSTSSRKKNSMASSAAHFIPPHAEQSPSTKSIHIPVSAKDAGLIPDRSAKGGGVLTGSDVAVDAFMEEYVARRAAQFITKNTM